MSYVLEVNPPLLGTGDAPAPFTGDVVDDDGDAADLSSFDGAVFVLRAPDGEEMLAGPAPIDQPTSTITYDLAEGDFDAPGLWQVTTKLVNGTTPTLTLSTFPIVVEALDGWTSLATARDQWRDAPADDALLWRLLNVARDQVTDFAPEPLPEPIPDRYAFAQLTQARNLWNATKSDPANAAIGDDGLLLRPFPLDWTVKRMIRPVRAKPVIA